MILFGGGYSTYYWQGCSWNVLIPDPFQQPANYTKPHFEYDRHITDFFSKHEYGRLKPAPERNASGYCLSGDNEKYLIYVPKENYKVDANYLIESAA